MGGCLSGVPGWRGAPGDTYVSRPAVTGRGSTHSDKAFMGLTSSGDVAVDCKLQARAAYRPVLFAVPGLECFAHAFLPAHLRRAGHRAAGPGPVRGVPRRAPRRAESLP